MGSTMESILSANSRVSFLPLIRTWEKVIQTGKGGDPQLYKQLLDELSTYPALLKPIESEEVLKEHSTVISRILSTLFPVTMSDEHDVYAILQPFNHRVLYASTFFRQLFLQDNDEYVNTKDFAAAENIKHEKICGAYQLILNQIYNVGVEGEMTSVQHITCPTTSLDRYMEMALDAQFVDVVAEGEIPEVNTINLNGIAFHDLFQQQTLIKEVPIEKFRFDGFVILRIKEVTQREIINKIKSNLLNIHSFADEKIFGELDYQMQNLACVQGLHTAIKPYFMVNNHPVLSEVITTNKTAKKYPLNDEQQYELYKEIDAHFKASPDVIVVNDINALTLERYPFLHVLYEHNFKSVIVAPLIKNDNHLLGVLFVAHRTEALGSEHLARIKPAIPLFAIALEKSQEQLDHEVDKVIKEQFTAVQDAVAWRFTKAALSYLTRKDKSEQMKMESIVFEQVYPLYGAIDIRNSSVERNNAIQLDLLEQLQMAANIIKKAQSISNYPLLEEMQFRIEKFTNSVSKILFAEEENAIHDFLTIELAGIMNHLKPIMPSLESEIIKYVQLLDSPVKMLYHHRREYEESITKINTELAMLMDREQKFAQSIYPHYFERFVTDGIDYNIYIGQSITPRIPFSEFYLKNLKIWQLTTLAKAANLAYSLESQLALPLRTTQLILAHSFPISVSFKTEERKFDVEGAYNMRYEIIKKRIDKVRIKDSNERFTQPGTIAIVYSQIKEAQEYLSYIEFLQNKGLLQNNVERYELEELQGISGLRGLRVAVSYGRTGEWANMKEEKETSKLLTTTQEL